MARVEKTIEVDVPVRTVYNQWTQFESFPQFMDGVEEVRQLDDRRLHWRAKIAGKEEQWDATIREQVPDEKIIWMATSGAENAGMVTFDNLGEARTRVHLEMSYDPEGFVESIGDALGFMSRRVEGDLERFKDFIEARSQATGEWRGTIENPDVPGGHTRGDTTAEPSGKGSGQHGNIEGPGGAAPQNTGSQTPGTMGTNTPGGTTTGGGSTSSGEMRSSSLGEQQDDMGRASYGPESTPLGRGENASHPEGSLGGGESVIPGQDRGTPPGQRAGEVRGHEHETPAGPAGSDSNPGPGGPSGTH